MPLDKDFKSLMWFMAKMLAVFATLYVLLNLFTCNLNDYKYRNLEVVAETTEDLIVRLSKENNFNTTTALRIAECESQYGKYKHNWEGSSAKGIYMFTDRTWKHYCDGDVLNDYDNIRCFIKLYPTKPHWWACQ